ncbi:hypothetical protein [Mediterraneibacter agrestimuris]|uniref:hypothetical protein n=1 Tax=Mediterraneibacter agrestimuris TaxID=2941333 RepID=UPI0020420422|nr:hypothetical protein [Mediterraneibacter agrestimuris]
MKYRKLAGTIAIVFAVAAAILGIGSVMAYLSDGDRAVNAFSIGSNEIVPDEPFDPVEPGKKTVKEPKAENTGTVDCYVRAKVLLSDSRAGEYITYYTGSTEGFHTKAWVKAEDGWMYYGDPVAPGEKTPAVFTHIKLKQDIPDFIKDAAIDVVFESVQSDGFEDAETAFKSIEGDRMETGKEDQE